MKYRVAKGHDWGKLEKLFESLGWPMPNRSRSQVIIAADDADEIVAFTVIEAWVHADRAWSKTGDFKDVSRPRMQRMMEDFLGRIPGQSYWMFSTDMQQEEIAKSFGFEAKAWKVWQKTFK